MMPLPCAQLQALCFDRSSWRHAGPVRIMRPTPMACPIAVFLIQPLTRRGSIRIASKALRRAQLISRCILSPSCKVLMQALPPRLRSAPPMLPSCSPVCLGGSPQPEEHGLSIPSLIIRCSCREADAPGCYGYTVTANAPCSSATTVVCVQVNLQPDAGTDGGATFCANEVSFVLFPLLGGSPHAGGTWTFLGILGQEVATNTWSLEMRLASMTPRWSAFLLLRIFRLMRA
jgi:hypothetical protein